MVERDDCPWCRAWHREIGPGYPNSTEGKIAPLRRIALGSPQSDLPKFRGVVYTPTFLLIVCGREVGRLVGYAGADFFYPLLQAQLAAVDPKILSAKSCH